MPMRKPQKQQNKQKIKFIKIRKNPDIEVYMSGFFLLYYIIYRTADRVELRIVYRNKSKKT